MNPSLIDTAASMYDLDMTFQRTLRRALEPALCARWRVLACNVRLQSGVGWICWADFTRYILWFDFVLLKGAYGTQESSGSVDPRCMRLQFALSVEPCITYISIMVDCLTGKWASTFVDDRDMLLQSSVLSERLPTACERTSKFLSAFMGSMMPPESCRSNEAFPTTFPLAHIVADVGVRRSDMVIQVRLAEEVFGTW